MIHRATETARIILQRNLEFLARTDDEQWPAVRDRVRPFAELVRLGGGYATFRLTPLSLWNATAAGLDGQAIASALRDLSGVPLPPSTAAFIHETLAHVGMIRLVETEDGLSLVSSDAALLESLCDRANLDRTVPSRDADGNGIVAIPPDQRGQIKLAFASYGYPIVDEVPVAEGEQIAYALRPDAPSLRGYQRQSVAAFTRSRAGGLVLLPCGAGKTLVGIAAAATLQARTLVLCPGRTNAAQWERAFRAWTDLPDAAVGVYDGARRTLFPVTIATYQALTSRARGADLPRHLGAFMEADWGLVIYDEAHMLPADGFRLCASAAMQARRRLGLTATLIREDGRETDAFALIGPVLFNRPWRELEGQGWIAPATCVEVRVPLATGWLDPGAIVDARAAAVNPRKDGVVETLLARHRGASTLVIGGHVEMLTRLARRLRAPLIMGETPTDERDRLYTAFREGRTRVLVVSRVANQGVDLPGATVAIQVSGHFGSRQEEAQRLGRLLRPNADGAPSTFYTLVTTGTREVEYARHRRLFLSEQGYAYRVERISGA
ncbi:MAG TPA: helicase-associated domain-containing protein [Thermomicrobiales bacterium]